MKTPLVISILAGSCACLSASITIYSEAFQAGGGNTALNVTNAAWDYKGNWRANYSPDGTLLPNGNTSGPVISASGFVFFSWSQTNVDNKPWLLRDIDPVFAGTAEHLEVANLRQFSLDFSRGTFGAAAQATVHPVIQVGGTWYVHSAGFSNPASATFTTYTSNINSDLWNVLSFTSDVEMTVGAVSNTLSNLGATGSLQTVGFLANTPAITGNSSNSQFRLDNVTVTAIPEPSTYAVFAGMLALSLVVLRRKRA